MSDSEQPYEQRPARLLCPQDSLGKNTGVGCHYLLQGLDQYPANNSPAINICSFEDKIGKDDDDVKEKKAWCCALVSNREIALAACLLPFNRFGVH